MSSLTPARRYWLSLVLAHKSPDTVLVIDLTDHTLTR